MTLHVKDSGSWEQVDEVHVKKDGFWNQVKEVYIKENGEWKAVLFENNTNTITATGAGTIDVPVGAFRARVTLEGGNGGKGGDDAYRVGGAGGDGASITAVIEVDPFTTLSYNIASGGNNGVSSQGSAAGGTGGTGYAAGGNGGQAGSAGSSGGGGGGGGASSISAPDSTVLMVAGGGGGGGGAGHRHDIGLDVRSAGSASTIGSSEDTETGENGEDCGTADGAGAGGGGGGVAGLINQGDDVTLASTRRYAVFTSWGYQREEYKTDFKTIRSMRVVNRQSSSACTLGYSYGFTGSTAWVDNGCRAEFEIIGDNRGGSGGQYQGSYDSDGYPGEEGFSYVNTDLIGDFDNATRTETGNGDDGRLTIIWLPE